MSKPKTFQFTFDNNQVINLDAKDSKVKLFSDEIVAGKRKLIKAQLTFESGEVFTANYNGQKWTSIKISYKDKEASIPQEKLEKITEIHFSTLFLVWSSDSNEAFNASYFIIEFELGNTKYFDKLPRLEIGFAKQKFSHCVIWKSVKENATQWSEF